MAIDRDDIDQILDKLAISEVCAFAVDALMGFDLRTRTLEGRTTTDEENMLLLEQYEAAVVGSTFASVRDLAFDELLRTSEHMTEHEFRLKFEL
jgi:hypothetical protein